jgi:anti-sigma regulatory factor (Ser/Thr protein kinase)
VPFTGLGQAREHVDSIAGGSVSRALPANLAAVREARHVVADVLSRWSADSIFDDVALVASELVANALRHGLQVEQKAAGDVTRVSSSIQISLVSTGSHVICSVTDPSEHPPIRRPPDPLAGSGRGLQLVESLSLCWGWTVLEDDTAPSATVAGSSVSRTAPGKSVWAIFPLGLGRARGAA